MQPFDPSQPVCAKQLAHHLRVSIRFIYAMKRDGFHMPRRLASHNQAIQWLEANPEFRVNKPKEKKWKK